MTIQFWIIAGVLGVVGAFIFAYARLHVKYELLNNKFRKLLKESQGIDNIQDVKQQAVAKVMWRMNRDDALREGDSLINLLSKDPVE